MRLRSSQQQIIFVIEHELQPLAGDIARRFAIDRVAELHVVGRDRLGDRAGGSARLEKYARHFLTGADFRKRSVLVLVEIDRERLAVGGEQFLFFAHDGAI